MCLCQFSSYLLCSLSPPLPFSTHLCVAEDGSVQTTLLLCQLYPYLDLPVEIVESDSEPVVLEKGLIFPVCFLTCWSAVNISPPKQASCYSHSASL